MLAAKFTENTPLPLSGSTGFLRGTCQQARVIQLGRDNVALVELIDRFGSQGASRQRRVPAGDLFPTVEEAIHGGTPPRQSRRAQSDRRNRRKGQ